MDEFGLPRSYSYQSWNGQQSHDYNSFPNDNPWPAWPHPQAPVQATPAAPLPTPSIASALNYTNYGYIFNNPGINAGVSFEDFQSPPYGFSPPYPMPPAPQTPGNIGNPGLPQLSPSNFLFATHLSTHNNLHAQASFGLQLPQPGASGFQPQQHHSPYSFSRAQEEIGNLSNQQREQQPHNWSHPNGLSFLPVAPPPPPPPIPAEPTSDDYLQALADGDFSSPSFIPSRIALASPHLAADEEVQPAPHHDRTLSDNARDSPQPQSWNDDSDNDNMPPHKRTVVARRSTRSSRAPDEALVIDSSSPPPAASRRQTISLKRPAPTSTSTQKTRGTTQSRGIKRQRDEDLDPFRSDDNDELAGLEVVNLVEEPKKKVEEEAPKKNMVRLAQYNCVICMDDCTGLTVTQCGHLFCAECLHSALNVDRSKTICPICRQKLDLKQSNKKKAKPFVHLELKLMSKNRAGKRPAKV